MSWQLVTAERVRLGDGPMEWRLTVRVPVATPVGCLGMIVGRRAAPRWEERVYVGDCTVWHQWPTMHRNGDEMELSRLWEIARRGLPVAP